MANVKKIGNKCESLLLDILKKKNYWCHLFASKDSGQPCDVIALKGDKHYLIDVKHCDTNVFYFSRIESNQHNCFRYAIECDIYYKDLGFAIYEFDLRKRGGFAILDFLFSCGGAAILRIRKS